jgi:hypothetical protein
MIENKKRGEKMKANKWTLMLVIAILVGSSVV